MMSLLKKNHADEDSFEEAWNIVRTERKASASYLQRRLRIGYNKAARLMELMEERGYVGPQIGAKPRDILK
jgi:DNA segregation ATPase FtsK/SpoIIIE, S-DNA-T family